MEKSIGIKQSIEKIKDCLKMLNTKILSLSEFISEQKMVDSDTINTTMAELLKLSQVQQECQEEYLTIFPGKECSKLLCEIENQVNEYEAQMAANKLKEEAKNILVKFASIRSDIEQCQKQLDIYAQQLECIDEDNRMNLDEYKSAVAPYEDFYNAVDTDNVNEKISYSLKKSIFSSDTFLMLNVIQGKVYIDKEKEYSASDECSSMAEVTVNEEPLDQVEETGYTEPSGMIEDYEKALPTEEDEDTVSFSDEEKKAIEEVKAAGIRIGARTEYGNPSITCSENLSKVDSKTFKKDMEKFKDGNGFLLYGFDKYSLLSKKLLNNGHKINGVKLDFSPMIESLLKLGYIMKRTIGDFEPIYDITIKACNCLEVPQNRNWFNRFTSFSYSTLKNALSRKPEASDEYLANDILTEVCCIVFDECCFANDKKINIASKTTIDEFFCARKFKISSTDVFVSVAFLSDDKSMAEYVETSNKFISEFDNSIPVAVIMSDNVDECERIMSYWKLHSTKFENTRFVFYSAQEKMFFDYSEGRVIDKVDLLSNLAEQTTVLANTPEVVENPKNEEDSNIKESKVTSDIHEEIAASSSEKEINQGNSDDGVSESADEPQRIDEPKEIEKESHEDNIISFVKISDAEVLDNVYDMIINDKAYCASAYLNSLSSEKKYEYLKNILAFAMNAPDKKGFYISNIIMSYFDDTEYDFGKFANYMRVCADLRTLFYNVSKQDYGYRQMYDSIRYLDIIQDNNELSDLLFKLKEFKDEHNMGIDAVADYRIKENLVIEEKIKLCSTDAKNMYDQYIMNPIKETCALPRYMDMKKLIFKKDNDLSECLRIVSENNSDEDEFDYVRDFIHSCFIDEEMDIRSDNIRRHSVGEYVDSFWIEAGKSQRDKQKSSKLVSELRHNICGCIAKIITLICDWYYYSSMISVNGNVKGYEKDKNIIGASIINALDLCNRKIKELDDKCDIAGYKCIKAAVAEFKERLDGSYDDNGNKYYYVDFLKYGDVMLDENYLPDCSGYNVIINGFMPYERVLSNSKKADRNFIDRIDEIFYGFDSDETKNFADDYGCAKLIKAYMEYSGEAWDDEKYNIELNMADAWNEFVATYDNAIGSLELEQSYGMIDADNKEKVLELNYLQYEKAKSTHNYGFFRRLLACLENNILSEAKKREVSLSDSLNTVESEYSDDQDVQKLVLEAKEMMKIQNYTVAEDIIHRIQSNDLSYNDSVMSEDNLKEFIREYESIYRIVGDAKTNLVMAINRNTRGPRKDVKRGATLIENFPVGKNTNSEKIRTLVSYLGFKVKNVSIDKGNHPTYDSFAVELQKNANGKKENFTHPIAPFGSLALENGFRVICLFGTYDAQRLIDKFKEIGTSKHTIVLLDYSLNHPERRDLARKIKKELSDKVFIVIDRVTIYFLADHYAENKINRMLMEITMPYSSYQPYSIDSARAIPVEMFMGRKQQLEDIESPKGANIICGGRQLGKSALLRMAKSDINNNENGDRAVYVEIKECDYTKAARKISETLVDEGILDEGCECDNWNDLSRYIKKRLTNEKLPRIPYLLLLIDEADTFIESCKQVDYAPFDNLEDIQSVGVDRFKFVVAGLRNLVKFEREKATSNNSVLAHLSHKTIRPFTTAEAQELLEKPLHYLGIRFPNDKSKLVPLILANTNYFPGLIHFYCAKLIEVLKDYPGYNVNSTPSYEVNETHIKRVLADPEFNHQIKEKFEITLKLDADNYYHIIAVIMAYCSYNENNGDGYSVADIYRIAQEYCIEKIQKLGTDKLGVLMDELCELNILRKSTAGNYLFARYNFIQLLGTSEEIENLILIYSEE